MVAFRYSFGCNTWRNANFLSFHIFEENPQFTSVTKFFRKWVYSFRCGKSVRIWTRSALFLSESSCRDPSSQFPYFFKLFKTQTMVEWFTLKYSANILVVKFSSSSTAAKVPGRWNLMVDHFFICKVCIAWFEPSLNLVFANCSFVKKVVEITEWLLIASFLEVVEHNMIIEDYFKWKKSQFFIWAI